MTKEEQTKLLEIARKSLSSGFSNTKYILDSIPASFQENKATFVTLTKNGELRGCIGSLEACEPLYKDVERNAQSAAFSDSRFSAVDELELNDINIEISILSQPEPIQFSDIDDLLKKINPKEDGIILSADGRSATYLPQVWEQLPQKEQFLSSLCQKAGLLANRWESPGVEIKKYQVESFSE